MSSIAASQVPAAGELNLDHVAHYVPHMDAASGALEKLGFTLTPFSAQSHRPEPGGPLMPAGTGNRCAMLERGYLEFLTPIGDTPIANQMRTAIKRYVGVHLIAFGTAAPEADHARLAKTGFGPLAPLELRREIDTASRTETARFTVVRVSAGTMAEGRIQFCRHRTPQFLWQERWLAHANRAAGLNGIVLCVADPQEAARRYARYTGRLAQVTGSVWRITTTRGYLIFVEPGALERRLGATSCAPPCIAGYVLESEEIAASGDILRRSGAGVQVLGNRRLLVKAPPALGGLMIFEPANSGALNFD
jgi:hypothetical protein